MNRGPKQACDPDEDAIRERVARTLARTRRFAGRAGVVALVAGATVGMACAPDEPADPSATSPAAETQPTDRLNVLLISIDTLRADALGAYDPTRTTSPHIDRLAKAGVLFEQCVTSSPSTLPSHATILTGKHPFVHGVRSNLGYALADAHQTLAEALQDAGYRTAAEIAAPVMARRTRLDQGFETFRDLDAPDVRLKPRATPEATTGTGVAEREAADITRRALAFLRQPPHAQPFFLWLHYFDPHAPYAPPEEFAASSTRTAYHGEVAYTDFQVGRVVAELEQQGLLEHTLVVLTSDHGESLGEHGEDTHSFLVYDTTMRVPLILAGPKDLPRGRRVPELVRTIDIAATILDWLGLPNLEGAQGISLRPLATGASRVSPVLGYGESIELFSTFGTSVLRFVREEQWKYIHKVTPELYDLARDPHERDNRAAAEPQRIEELRSRLIELIADEARDGSESHAPVDPETVVQLRALGYVGGVGRIHDELGSLSLAGRDPSDTLADLARLIAAGADLKSGRVGPAVETLTRLRTRYPTSVPILMTLSLALTNTRSHAEAEAIAQRAIELAPEDVELHMIAAQLSLVRDALPEAESHLRFVLENDPCRVVARSALAQVLGRVERYHDQMTILAQGIEACPHSTEALNDYAYALATSPVDELRDGQRALEIAKRITRDRGDQDPARLDTLAVAHAEVGEAEVAARTLKRAIAILEERGAPEAMLAVYRAHLASLEAGRPIRAR